MYRLPTILVFLGLAVRVFSQSPHGADFKVNCAACHTSAGWEIPFDAWNRTGPVFSRVTGWQIGWDTAAFNHNKTNFQLKGQHAQADCRACHESLVFSQAQTGCISCHKDMHSGTVGSDCARCHTTNNWLVDNINELHQDNGFPLVGVHASTNCIDCHKSETGLRFDRIGNACVNCHLVDYTATTNPDHKGAGFSTNCVECHDMTHQDWTTDKVKHDFFPLTKGHAISDCAKCHAGGDYANTSPDCISCHQPDYAASTDPNHTQAQFSKNCTDCHTTDANWMPAKYSQHDVDYFPIYSGAHQGTWNKCADCHSNTSDYTQFTCTSCHANPTTDNQHGGVNGYSYNSPACLACHPNGNATDVFDHSKTNFPLTGAHLTVNCTQCHTTGYAGTPTNCSGCHTPDYNQSANPGHTVLGLPTDCASCHTTAGWSPATFAIHNNYYPLNGAHAAIATDCATCHHGNYTNTPNTCAGCHTSDYNQTTDPNHVAAKLSTDCKSCHNETAWVPSTFDHNSFYPLTGAHAAIAKDCNACHNGNYTNTPNTCAGCHTTDYNQTTDPNHLAAKFPTDCKNCHNETAWVPSTFDHNSFYPLTGAHAAIAKDCNACHHGDYTNTPNTCAGCHTPDYNQTANPSHTALTLPTDCAGCHTTGGWAPATFTIHNNFYPLNGAHAAIANDCATCHKGNYTNTPNTCAGCHTPDYNQTTNPNHVTATFPTDCKTCHSETAWVPSTFDHNNFYPLTGMHATIAMDCNACHHGNYTNTPNTCAGCHTPDYNQTTNPSHTTLALPMDCAGCHTTGGWSPATFTIHSNYYPLNGAHAAIANDCATCHKGNYTNTPNTCAGCHTPDYNQTTNPNHAAAQFPTDCAACHNETTWAPATFDHDGQYFPIYSGAHNGEWNQCADCHTNPSNFAEFTCTTCHANPQTNNQHAGVNGYTYTNSACLACHPTGNATNIFDHNTTAFPLTGAHLTTNCIDCHASGFAGTPTACASCHTPDYNQSTNPNHAALAIPTDCAECHTTNGWQPATFAIHNHYYPLNGAHAAVANDCATCHQGNYNNTPNTCAGCHIGDYNKTTNPNHVTGQFSTDCKMCHGETAWSPSTFDHNSVYPLTGAHATIASDCNACHQGNYTNTPNTCAGCHTPDYNQTTNPNHVALAIPTDCASCHTNVSWQPATFAIHNNYYPLNGAHAAIATDCATCHNGNYNNTPNTCAGCHIGDYNKTSNPNHVSGQFPTDCATCHGETTWVPSTLDHNSFYPLTGAHAAIANDCNTCHQGNYTSTPNTCAGCHTPNYNQTTNPNHVALAIPTDCASCHTNVSWQPATFAIHNNYYPLNGAHAAIASDCATCHNGNYNNTPNTCVGCHQTNYNQTTNPNHAAEQFPTDCASCHSETAWAPSTFNHNNYYPLNGAHATIANDCNACHNGNYTTTPNTCVGCHQTNYNQTTNPNHAAAQFPTDCASCHNETAWVPSTFDHNNFYPLTGAHAAIANDCNACHQGNYTSTPNTCAGCHTPNYNQTTNPNHVALAIPTDCASCHTNVSWQPATFAIHNNYYPLNGAHATIASDCTTCHNGNYNNTPNTCVGCHQTNYNQTTNPSHAAAQFPTDCATCHSETAWVPSTLDHNSFYPLTGAHAAIANDCNTCHQGNYTSTPNTCAGCHTPNYNQTTNPNHLALAIPTDCASCHTNAAWQPATFAIHNNYYALNGAHAAIATDCAACHNGNYNNTPNTCVGCHQANYNQTTNPNHVAEQFPTDCATCHSETAWVPSTFDHNSFYPLNGAHATIANDCNACHNGNYNNTPNTCVGCHQTNYNQTTNPNHGAAQLPTDCASCHNETAWVPSTFDHNSFYPLTGAHAAIANDCNACHQGNYTTTPNTCAGCHTPNYNQTTNPNHVALGIPTDCASCHTNAAWQPATFAIHNNYYALNGAHAAIANDCAACHNGNYNNTPNTCAGCHIGDYNQTTSPNHVQQQFPTNCASCHDETAWIPSTFDHNTVYPLTGAHAAIANDCNDCHHGNYTNTPNTCAACHTTNYNQTTNPNHVSLTIPTDCAQCHTTNGWAPATFPIHNNYYQLNGAHAAIANNCAACHNGNYNNTPNTCYGCHQANYTQATNPNHVSAGFPVACQNCHTETAWTPSTFNHDGMYFPIYHGKHKDKWNLCADCHTNASNFAQFTCITCHTNPETNNHHQGVSGYSYNSAACLSCHPNGSAN